MITKERRAELVSEHKTGDDDTGSSQVQVAILTTRIREITEHLKTHKQDHAARRGLLKMVGRRSRLLKYLSRTQPKSYRSTIEKLGLRK